MIDSSKKVEWILRVGIFGTFLGHGIFGLQSKASWIPCFTMLGFSESTAITLLPLIGILDIAIAILALVKPYKIVLSWAIFWAISAQILLVTAGKSPWEFVEHVAYWMMPWALLVLHGYPKSFKDSFRV